MSTEPDDQIIRDARDHGVEVRPVCIATSDWDCALEPAANAGDDRFAVRSACA